MVENRNTGQTVKKTDRQADSDMTGRKIDTRAGRCEQDWQIERQPSMYIKMTGRKTCRKTKGQIDSDGGRHTCR